MMHKERRKRGVKRYVYVAMVAGSDGSCIDNVHFSSYKAARVYRPKKGHVTAIVQWPLYSSENMVEE